MRKGRTSGERNRILDGSIGLYAVDLFTGEVDQRTRNVESGSYSLEWALADDGTIAASKVTDTDSGAWRIENAEGKRIAQGRQQQGYVDLVGLSADGRDAIYAILDDTASGRRHYGIALRGDAEPVPLWQEKQVERFVRPPNSDRIIGVQDERNAFALGDPAAQQRLSQVIGAFRTHEVEVADWTDGFGSLLVRTSGDYDSGTWYRVDGATGDRALLGLERPTIQGLAIGKTETLSYTAADGLSLEAVLTLPPARDPSSLPVIVLPHGGPIAHDQQGFDWWAQAFAARGYAVLQPNFRGSTGYGPALVAAADGQWGRKMQTDLSDALAALADRGVADPDRACIVGSSYGGYAALAGVTLQQGVYRCAVSVNGIGDLFAFMREERRSFGDVARRNLDLLLGEDSDLKALSPSRIAARANAPILLIHGRDDTVVPYAQAKIMEDALKDAGKPVMLVTLEGEDHWLSRADTRKRMLAEAVAFVERHNPAD